jgi:dCMP deaminase
MCDEHEHAYVDRRPDWDTYFMQIAHVVKLRANCSRRMVAAVIVKDKRIIATGYNGTPRGVKNCFEGRCPRCAGNAPSGSALDECICSHAEENAIVQSAYHGISTKGATMYVTLNPCLTCAKMIINAGIKEVIYDEEYRFSEQTKALLAEGGVLCRKFAGTRLVMRPASESGSAQ